MKIERRSLNQEFRVSDDAQPTITGHAALFNAPTNYGGMWTEIIDEHAFDGVLTQDIRGLYNHNPDHVLGRTASGTMTVSVDDKGLAYTIVPPDTQLARDLIVSMRRKDITGSSFGFICTRDLWTDESDGSVTRRILEVSELLDCSVVTYPAYDGADSHVRSLPDSMPAEFRSRFEARAKPKTKHVDGEDLTADCFLIVGDPQDTSTWKLPWKFSTDDKTKSHLRNALARIDQVKGVSDDDLKAAKDKLADLCKKYDIDVSESKSVRALTDQCTCTCPQCMTGSCGICSADPQCMGAERNSTRSTDDEWRELTMLRLCIAESE